MANGWAGKPLPPLWAPFILSGRRKYQYLIPQTKSLGGDSGRERIKLSKGHGATKRTKKWRRIKTTFRYRCLYCDSRRNKRNTLDPEDCLTLDRFIPASSGGKTYFWNCIPTCKRCNDNKQSLSFDEFIVLHGFSREAIQSRWIEAIIKLLPNYFKERDHGYWHSKRKLWFDYAEKEFKAVINGLKKE